jgi:L-cysteine:1D-myo-inositol 2-amino-2-deoxy-alpha-D-glucopyranoside ligase
MRLYNSFTATTGEFRIPDDRPVALYVCGVTPYATTHMGHARTYLTFDVLVRYLRWQGAEVNYCQNVTDVDDPLFERAKRDGVHWRDLAEDQTRRYVEDSAELNMLPPTYFPRASEEMAAMHSIIEQLVKLGHAYVVDGNVYFDIATDPDFGTMARLGYTDMLSLANERGNRPDDPRKRDPLDFVLWQRGNPDDPAWESPWGPGRPGWHIECSAMATRYLGPQIDIHGGGYDLIFPHHACEIAQTEPATGQKPFAHFWMHAALVWFDGEKMSKSRGNLVFVRDALREHDANTLRWYLLSKHYREQFDYQPDLVRQSAALVAMVLTACHDMGGSATPLDIEHARQDFDAALADDLNTPQALAVLSSAAQQVHTAASEGRDIQDARSMLADMAWVLGLQTS